LTRNNPEKQFIVGVIESGPVWNTIDDEIFGSCGGSLVSSVATDTHSRQSRFGDSKDELVVYCKVNWKWIGSTVDLVRNKAGKVGYLCSLRCFSAIGEGSKLQ
jgi:hypothetical protein